MNAHIENLDYQIIEKNNKPEFVVVPYDQFQLLLQDEDELLVPHEVVGLGIEYQNNIKAWRKYLKISQKQLAAKTGITQAAISQMEKPSSKPHMKTLKEMARALQVDWELLKF